MPKRYKSDLYYGIEIIIGSLIIWGISYFINQGYFVYWGLMAFLATLERDIRYRRILFTQRLIMTLTASIITLLCLFLFGPGYKTFYLSLIIAMVIGNIFHKHYNGWRIIPASVAVLNYLAMNTKIYSHNQDLILLMIRLFENILGASLAIIILWITNKVLVIKKR